MNRKEIFDWQKPANKNLPWTEIITMNSQSPLKEFREQYHNLVEYQPGVKGGYIGCKNVKNKQSGRGEDRQLFLKHTTHCRLGWPTPLDGKYKKINPNTGRPFDGHWEKWQLYLDCPGYNANGVNVKPTTTVIQFFQNIKKGRCEKCSPNDTGRSKGWFMLPKCPSCKELLSEPKHDNLTKAIFQAIDKAGITIDGNNWYKYECRIYRQTGTGKMWVVKFFDWGTENEIVAGDIQSEDKAEPVPEVESNPANSESGPEPEGLRRLKMVVANGMDMFMTLEEEQLGDEHWMKTLFKNAEWVDMGESPLSDAEAKLLWDERHEYFKDWYPEGC